MVLWIFDLPTAFQLFLLIISTTEESPKETHFCVHPRGFFQLSSASPMIPNPSAVG